jgi:hypothetical protein
MTESDQDLPNLYVEVPPLPVYRVDKLAEEYGDYKLALSLEKLISRGDTWSLLSAVGRFCRWLYVDDGLIESSDQRVLDWENGPKQWVKQFTTVQIEHCDRLLMCHAEALFEDLDGGEYLAIEHFLRREDIECVRLLLGTAGYGDLCASILEDIDRPLAAIHPKIIGIGSSVWHEYKTINCEWWVAEVWNKVVVPLHVGQVCDWWLAEVWDKGGVPYIGK